MANPKLVDAQRDFTAGEVDPTAKRADDDAFLRTGMRQLSNARILNTRALTNRPGRNLIAKRASQARDEDVTIAPGVIYRLSFTNAALTIFNAAGTQVFTEAGRAWTGATLNSIVWVVFQKQIFITYPGVVPEVLTWDGATTWSSASYAEMTVGSQKRTPFYRLASQGITLLPSATTGSISLAFSGSVLVNGMIGTRLRFGGRQIQITAVASAISGTGLVIETLPPAQTLTVGSTVGGFNVGDVVEGKTTTAKGIVTSNAGAQTIFFPITTVPDGTFQTGDPIVGGTSGATGIVTGKNYWNDDINQGISQLHVTLTAGAFVAAETVSGAHGSAAVTSVSGIALVVQLIQSDAGIVSTFGVETVVGPSGTAAISGVATTTPQAISVWDQEVMNSYQGWPASVFTDQNRLGFTNFPSVPGGIAWSAIGIVTDLYPGANPSDAIFELAPGKSQVLHVVPGAEGSEFVFTDTAVYYIPISETNPLRPGSVAFKVISSDGSAAVQPRRVGSVILYVDQGLIQIQSIVAVGATNRPYESQPLTDAHAHLFNGIVAIALPTSVTQFAERYIYALNADGTLALGKYSLDERGNLAGKMGWLPWNGTGAVKWVSALNDAVLFCTAYTSGATVYMIEQLDATLYLDASLPINAIPATLTPPGGKGPLWWLPGVTVNLMDGVRPLGPYATDANGFVVPNFPGEDLTAVTLRAGFGWTATWEPFVRAAQPGQDVGQRMRRRRASRFEVYAMQSSGFRFIKMNIAGTVISDKRIATWNIGDDPNLPPPLREDAYSFKPLGHDFTSRVAIQKDTPGPLTVPEIAIRVTV